MLWASRWCNMKQRVTQHSTFPMCDIVPIIAHSLVRAARAWAASASSMVVAQGTRVGSSWWAASTARANVGVMQWAVAWRKKAVVRPGWTKATMRRRGAWRAMRFLQWRHVARAVGDCSNRNRLGWALKVILICVPNNTANVTAN